LSIERFLIRLLWRSNFPSLLTLKVTVDAIRDLK
jgi:hypothetical protein